ncbi:hect E3 ubiquitin ligase [Culex quinquefasciatus]|uniref:Hect E3 ubiquitin ligase n=1 Tax=Culex quinquefasciatus TaxID=7176 RepID=B0XHY6_CULQU|nr:hect E3 ubiquitin ligase [Culex quinquefasciatus]|eukprot:XP_001869258.1 hect E3 ubiquitin ligase [Culex quinquefasciatus]
MCTIPTRPSSSISGSSSSDILRHTRINGSSRNYRWRRRSCEVFPLNKLAAFSPEEIRNMLCGEQNPEWTRENIMAYTI